MDIAVHWTFLSHASVASTFYRGSCGVEVRNDGYGGMRWITVGSAG